MSCFSNGGGEARFFIVSAKKRHEKVRFSQQSSVLRFGCAGCVPSPRLLAR